MIYSLTPFFNELDILEIRLATLDPVVDCHVIVESNITHSGDPKPLFFKENVDRFRPWMHKIDYIEVELDPSTDAVEREASQRNSLSLGLPSTFSNDDYVLLSDVDEIPHPDVLRHVTQDGASISLVFPMYVYHLNWRWLELEETFTLCRVFPMNRTLSASLQLLRLSSFPILMGDAVGWHFAYMGGVDSIKYKLRSFLHHDVFDISPFNTEDSISETLETGRDIFHRDRTIVETPLSALPGYVQDNQRKFGHLLR